MIWTMEDIIKATDAKLVLGNLNTEFLSISTDTRTIGNQELFVPLVGENFDGHNFIANAHAKGAKGALVKAGYQIEDGLDQMAFLEVDDTLFALGELARYCLSKSNIPVLAVTGSTGKTTTKEFLAGVLEVHMDGVLKTLGNFNNLIGLPLTVLNITKEHKVAVLEMGMNMRGEIRRLAQIAKPGIGIITNVSAVHLEKLKTIGNVAQAKGELLESFGADHIAVLNADDELVAPLAKGREFKTITFGIENKADVRAENIHIKGFEGIDFLLCIKGESKEVHLSCIGKHNIYNALAAAGAAYEFGVNMDDIVHGLEAFRPVAMRSRILDIFGIKVIDDTYNANPSSMDAALSMLVELTDQGKSIAVLGDMFELGDESVAAHRRLGRHAAKLNIDKLYLIGPKAGFVMEGAIEEAMEKDKIKSFKNHADLVFQLRDECRRKDVILVKGSRGMRMERIVKGLKGEQV